MATNFVTVITEVMEWARVDGVTVSDVTLYLARKYGTLENASRTGIVSMTQEAVTAIRAARVEARRG